MQDDHGPGVPVCCYVGDQETADEVKVIIKVVVQATQKIYPEFHLTNFMIDKSKAEIKAITELGYKYYLCKFHDLQDWERFLRSSRAGVLKTDQGKVIHWMIALI